MYGQPQRCEAGISRRWRSAVSKRCGLLHQGHNQSETARRLNVARQTVSEWRRQYREQGAAGLRQAGRALKTASSDTSPCSEAD